MMIPDHEIILDIRHSIAGSSIQIVCHVEVAEYDPVTKKPYKIFRQPVDVVTFGKSDDFTMKQKIVEGIIQGFQEILEWMKRSKKI